MPVKVRWLGLGIGLVRCVAFGAREDVVGRDVDEEGAASLAFFGQRASSVDIDLAGLIWVLVTEVWGLVCGTYELSVYDGGWLSRLIGLQWMTI